MGDILLQCAGGTPGASVAGNVAVYLPVAITNRLLPDGTARDAALTVEAGSAPAAFAGSVSGGRIDFHGVSFVVPAGGAVTLRIGQLRAAAIQTGPARQPIEAHLALTGLSTLSLQNNRLAVAVTSPGLLATFSSAGIRCVGSPLPSSITVNDLFEAGTRFASTRFTEGHASAFQVRDAAATNGTRILVRYSGFPAGARLFVPDVVAGSNAAVPTAGGDLGTPRSGGRHVPGSATLLLARVVNPDANGAGGIPLYAPGPAGAPAAIFNGAGEVSLSGGAGFVVYEVVDANDAVRESAQFPAFIGIGDPQTDAVARQEIFLAPVSALAAASETAPVPRYAAIPPGSDCPTLGDCQAGYFPALSIFARPIEFTAIAGGAAFQSGYIGVQNTGSGLLNWTATVSYQSGADWLSLNNRDGLNNESIEVVAKPQKLAPGTYEATITIDGGPVAGSRTLPVRLVVSPAPAQPPVQPPAQPSVVVSSVENGASFLPDGVVAGSVAVVRGARLSGSSVAVTFDGIPGRLLYTGERQVNVEVPGELAAKASVQMVVTVDGAGSAPRAVTLAAAAPAIFAGGVLNQDGSVNGPAAPAPVGSVLQIFLTGLPATGAPVVVKLHDREDLPPAYAGAAPGSPGLQQVNIPVPEDLPAMTTEVVICTFGAGSRKVCSRPALITLSTP